MSPRADPRDAADLLARTPAFGSLDRDTLERLAERCELRSYRRGQLIFQQGDPGDRLFVVRSGLVNVMRVSWTGEEFLLATLRPPDFFGEVAVVDGGPRSASAVALEPTTLLAIPRAPLLELMRESPSLLESLLQVVARLLRGTLERASDLVFLDLPGRVAKVLLELAEARGEPAPEGGVCLDLEITQGHLAAMVGGSRPTVNQILHAFQQRGYIVLSGRHLVIRETGPLARRAGV
jgi:CRP-like cAMP-binding protein